MKDENHPLQTVEGQVKWFDPSKGFGFIVSSVGGPDILLHANVLRNFGQSSVADGAKIEVLVQQTARGMQAVEINRIEPPESPDSIVLEDVAALSPEELENIVFEPARVKWFDKAKGFGFANVFGRAEDIFVHFEVLRRSGLADLQPGEAVCIRAVEGRRGRMAIQVTSWEAALHINAEPPASS